MIEKDYTYNALLVRVVDGDTVVVQLDMGFNIFITKDVRLAHINAPEHNHPGGSEATRHLTILLGIAGKRLLLRTYKPFDKYGRYLADVFVDGLNINQQMIADGFAVPYEGGAR